MVDQDMPDSAALWQEIEQGLRCAMQSHFADATAHFLKVRAHVSHAQTRFAVIIDAFLSSHSRYWAAQQALHSASQSFVVAYAEQLARLDELRQLLAEAPHQLVLPAQQVDARGYTLQPPTDRSAAPVLPDLPALRITCFGRFSVQRQGMIVPPCQNRNSQAILRYLVAQAQHCAPMEVLMELFWPDDAPEVARHKLHVAVSSLRRMLSAPNLHQKGTGYLVYDNGVYSLNPAAQVHTDVDDFVAAYQTGRYAAHEQVIENYEAACRLYTGPFLVEDLYADWSQIRREQLVQMYLTMCAKLAENCLANERYDTGIDWASRILSENRCDEAVYRQLMLAYATTGRRAEALRQFQRCKRSLSEEMGIEPSPETIELFQRLQRGEGVSPGRTALGSKSA